MVDDSLVSSNCYMECRGNVATMPGISAAVTRIMLNDLISEVDVTKYQHAPTGKAAVVG